MPQAADGGWGEDWSGDVERTYQTPPPAGLNERQRQVYRAIYRHWGRARSIPGQKLLSQELNVPPRTLKRDIATLHEQGWLDIDRRTRRGHRGGGRLRAGNTYFPKVSLNDLDNLPEGAFPPRSNRTEGPNGHAPSAQVTPRGQAPSWPLGGGGQVEETASSDRGAKPVDNPPNTPTVSENKPVEERVSPQAKADLSSPPGGPPFRTMAEEKAWVAAQRRAGHRARPLAPSARSSKQQELEREVRVVARNAQRLAALRGDVVAVLWAGDVGYALEPEEAVLVMELRDEGLLEEATLVPGDRPPPAPWSAPGPVRYGRLRLDAGPGDLHRAVDRLGWDTCTEGASCGRGRPCPRHQQRRREAS